MTRCLRFLLVFCTIIVLSTFSFRATASDESTTQSLDLQMTRLVPEGTFLIAYTSSVSKLTSELTDFAKVINPQMAGMVAFMGPQSLLSMQVDTKKKIRFDLPVAIAMVPGKTLQDDPMMTIIFAVDGGDKASVKPTDSKNKMIFLEGTHWVALTSGSAYEPASAGSKLPPIATNLLSGIAAVSFDQAMLRKRFGDSLEKNIIQGLESGDENEDPKTRELSNKVNAAIGKAFANGFDRWDMGLNLDVKSPSCTLQFNPARESWLVPGAPGIEGVGNRLASDLPVQLVLSNGAIQKLQSFVSMLLPAEGEGTAAKLEKIMRNNEAILEQVVDGVGVSYGMSAEGINVVKVMQVKDVKVTLTMIDNLMTVINDSKLGITVDPIPVTVGAETSRAFRMKLDMDQMKVAFPSEFKTQGQDFVGSLFQADKQMGQVLNAIQGPDGLIIRMISKDDWMAIIMGDPKLVGRTRRALADASGTNTSLQHAIETAYAAPNVGMSVDLRGFIEGMLRLTSKHPEIGNALWGGHMPDVLTSFPGSPPANVYMACSSTADANQMKFTVDLKSVVDFANDMEKLSEDAKKKLADKKKANGSGEQATP